MICHCDECGCLIEASKPRRGWHDPETASVRVCGDCWDAEVACAMRAAQGKYPLCPAWEVIDAALHGIKYPHDTFIGIRVGEVDYVSEARQRFGVK